MNSNLKSLLSLMLDLTSPSKYKYGLSFFLSLDRSPPNQLNDLTRFDKNCMAHKTMLFSLGWSSGFCLNTKGWRRHCGTQSTLYSKRIEQTIQSNINFVGRQRMESKERNTIVKSLDLQDSVRKVMVAQSNQHTNA